MPPDLGRPVFWGYSNGGREPVVFSAEGKECPTFGCGESVLHVTELSHPKWQRLLHRKTPSF